ncbi:MAG: chorismate synthase [Bacteroidales bacterium]|nr:chorismate synthase [Bacteroidales bacterium]
MNTFGNKFRVSIFGESHGERIGVVLDGVKPGLPLSEQDFLPDLMRRKAGAPGTTPRIEADEPEIVSGVFEGHTTGAPLTVLFCNTNTRGADYATFREHPRPGHADHTADVKFHGFNDPRGGGHFSGRITLGVVAAGVVAKKMAAFKYQSEIVELGGQTDRTAWKEALQKAGEEGDSLGAIVECRVSGVPIGLGEPFWDSVESCLAHALFAIPGVRGVEFGDGFAASGKKGSGHNDAFGPDGIPVTNHAGGVNGGITNGNPLVFRVAFKPTASIAKAGIPGRHDVCFALRTPVIVEAMAAIVLADLAL